MIEQLIMATIHNFSNFNDTGILRIAFDPYISIFGNMAWGLIFGFIGTGIYANERSIGQITAYLIVVGAIMGIIMPNQVGAIFGLILGFALTAIFYTTFVKRRK